MNVNIKFDSLVFLLISAFASYAYTAEPIVLKNEVGQLSVLPDGSMQLTSDNTQCPVWKLESSRLWEITLAKGTNPFHLSENATVFVSGKNVPIVSQEADGVKLNYTSISNGKQTWDIGLTLTVKHVDNEFQFIAVVDNQTEDWTVKSFKFPILFDIRLEGSDHQNLSVLWPNGLGQRMKTPAKFGKSQVADYPSKGASMQWCEVVAKEAGLYLGCHDNKKSYKKFEMVNQKDHYEFSLTQSPYCLPGKIWQSPPFVVMPFEGTWYVGAHRYRKWMDTWLHWAVTPDWIKTANSGWFLCILKQQNGDLMFRYDELDTVADIADEWGLDVLGLFGWAHGGHDREYPHYDPDPEMGGPEALKKAIKRVQKRGKKVILYANGQLIDSASDFYREKGVQSMLQQPDQKPSIQMYNKFKATSTPIFVQACLGSETWYQQLLQLGFQAQDLGADGIIYDQLGVGGPTACYNENHGHKTPTMAWAECRFRTIERLTKEFQKRDPDFIVMTEGLIDAEMADLPYFHGYSFGIFPFLPTPHQQAFPEMFRYTFPELVVTQRNSKPMADRDIVNFSTFFGFRHEIESRYVADVKYLKKHELPEKTEYSDVNYPPKKLDLILSIPPERASEYMRDVIELERRFKEFLWHGRFIDTEGITLEGEKCAAKGFLANDGRLGVVVWSYGVAPQTATISVDGFQLKNAFEPGSTEPVDAAKPIPGKTIRFYLWDPQ